MEQFITAICYKTFWTLCHINNRHIWYKSILIRNQLNEIIGQFVWTVFFCAFIFAVINNYQEWSNDIVNGLRNIAGEIGPSNIQIDQPLVVGYNMATTVIDKIKVGSFSDIAKSLGFIIGALIIIVTFALMTAQVI
jgi:type IV secretion system protein TrbL